MYIMSQTVKSLTVNIIPVTAYQQNCSLLLCQSSKKAAFIDPGGDIEVLNSALTESGHSLERIFITHGHLDHAGGAAQLAEQHQVPIEGPHRGDQYWLDDLENYAKMMNFPPTRNFHPQRWLSDGETIRFGDIVLDVIHCPGHTPGHVIFYHEASRLAMVGDVLFQGSIGRTDFPGGNHQDLLDSITQKLWPLGDDITFIPGHGPTSTFGHERKTNPFISDSRFG